MGQTMTRKESGALGGRKAHANGNARKWTADEARSFARKGGLAAAANHRESKAAAWLATELLATPAVEQPNPTPVVEPEPEMSTAGVEEQFRTIIEKAPVVVDDSPEAAALLEQEVRQELERIEQEIQEEADSLAPGATELLADAGGEDLPASNLDQPMVNHENAPPCTICGSIMVQSGECYKCSNCGAIFTPGIKAIQDQYGQ